MRSDAGGGEGKESERARYLLVCLGTVADAQPLIPWGRVYPDIVTPLLSQAKGQKVVGKRAAVRVATSYAEGLLLRSALKPLLVRAQTLPPSLPPCLVACLAPLLDASLHRHPRCVSFLVELRRLPDQACSRGRGLGFHGLTRCFRAQSVEGGCLCVLRPCLLFL